MALKAYMAYDAELGSRDGAVLVFAHNIREAKRLGHPFVAEWTSGSWIDTRVNIIKNAQFLFNTEANKDKLLSDTPHVVDSPNACESCQLWGNELNANGLCEDCQDEEDVELKEGK
jgi:hypothetical protein